MKFIDNTKHVLQSESSLIKKVGIGSLILLASIFILPYFLYQGYLVKILKETDGAVPDSLPEWTNWGGLFKDGLIAFGIGLVLSLPASVLNLVPQLTGMSQEIILLTSSIGSVLSLLLSYLTIAILAVGFRDGFGEAFSLNRLKPILFSTEYLMYWVITLAIGLGLAILAIPLVLFTLGVGLVLLLPLFVAVNFATMALAGLAITEVESDSLVQDTEQTAY